MQKVKIFFEKIFFFIATLFLISTITFILMKSIPGDPFLQEQAIPEEILRSMHAHYGLDQPLFTQYITYIKGVFVGDLGPSFRYEGRTTNDFIREGFPVSFCLGFTSFLFALFWGVLWGSLSAFYHQKWQDTCIRFLSVIGMSIPGFILATLLQYVFSIKLGWLPIARLDSYTAMILPVISLSAFPASFIAKLTRSSMIETLQKEYILTARSKGISSWQVWRCHVFKNSLLPIASYLGTLFSFLIVGSFVVEKIFGIPGLGSWFVISIINRDYTVIMGLTIFYSSIVLVVMMMTDFIYTCIDPRIHLKETVSKQVN